MSSVFWSQCLEKLQESISPQQLNTWLRPLQAEIIGSDLFLFAPNRFVLEWVNDKFLNKIQQIVADTRKDGYPLLVKIQIGSHLEIKNNKTVVITDSIESEDSSSSSRYVL